MLGTAVFTKDRDGERARRILEAAQHLFEKSGYSGTTLDDIVAEAGCSKSAIYQIFGSKEQLLTAVVKQAVDAMRDELFDSMLAGRPVRSTLENFVILLFTRVLSNSHVAMMQAVISAARQTPTLGERYWREGPMTNMANLARYLSAQASEKRLKIDDSQEAAAFLIGLTLWPSMLGRLVGTQTTMSEAEARHEAKRIVDIFVKVYSV